MKQKIYLILFFLVKNRIKYRNKSVLIIQKTVRGYLARKQHQPRVKGIIKISSIKKNMAQMENIATQLKNDKESMLIQVKEVNQMIDAAIKTIKVIN